MTETEKTVRKFMSETMPFTYKANNDGRLMTNLANFYDWLEQNEALAISRVVGQSEQLKPLPPNECEQCGVLIDHRLNECGNCRL